MRRGFLLFSLIQVTLASTYEDPFTCFKPTVVNTPAETLSVTEKNVRVCEDSCKIDAQCTAYLMRYMDGWKCTQLGSPMPTQSLPSLIIRKDEECYIPDYDTDAGTWIPAVPFVDLLTRIYNGYFSSELGVVGPEWSQITQITAVARIKCRLEVHQVRSNQVIKLDGGETGQSMTRAVAGVKDLIGFCDAPLEETHPCFKLTKVYNQAVVLSVFYADRNGCEKSCTNNAQCLYFRITKSGTRDVCTTMGSLKSSSILAKPVTIFKKEECTSAGTWRPIEPFLGNIAKVHIGAFASQFGLVVPEWSQVTKLMIVARRGCRVEVHQLRSSQVIKLEGGDHGAWISPTVAGVKDLIGFC